MKWNEIKQPYDQQIMIKIMVDYVMKVHSVYLKFS